MVDLTDELFDHWRNFRAGLLSRPALKSAIANLRVRVENALQRGTHSSQSPTASRCGSELTHPGALWVFAAHEGVEPTKNAATPRGYPSIRPPLILRRLTYGTQSATGSRFVETLPTINETCRQQGRNVIDFLIQAIEQARFGQPTHIPAHRPVNGYASFATGNDLSGSSLRSGWQNSPTEP